MSSTRKFIEAVYSTVFLPSGNRKPRTAVPGLLLLLITACSGGSSGTKVQAPSGLEYSATTVAAIVGTPITGDSPTVTGTVVSFSISPTLPAGLSLNASTGAISGTPTAVAAKATYVIAASNSAGSTTAAIQITVNPAVPTNLVYSHSTITAAVGVAMAPDAPTVTGVVTTYSVDPALPAGLSIDSSTGILSGIATTTSAFATYTVTGSNVTGKVTTTLQIVVDAVPTKPAVTLRELGHASKIIAVRTTANRVLTEDQSGHWVLWDYTSAGILASGDGANTEDGNQIDLAGPLIAIANANGIDIRSSIDGSLLFTAPATYTVPAQSWWKLASDGSYFCAGSSSGITVWSSNGTPEFTRPGDYHAANVFAAPNQLQIAAGAAGVSVIESVTVPGNSSSTTSAFSGVFQNWFTDGQHFITLAGNTAAIYTDTGIRQGLVTTGGSTNLTGPWLGGAGNWFWFVEEPQNQPQSLYIYAIGSTSASVTYTYTLYGRYQSSGTVLAVNDAGPSSNTESIIDLSGSTPSKTDYSLAPWSGAEVAALSASQWMAGVGSGVLVDGPTLATTTPRIFSDGGVTAITANSTTAAIATDSGKILLYDLSGPTLMTQTDSPSGELAFIADGSQLVSASAAKFSPPFTDCTLRFFSIPSWNVVDQVPYTYNTSGTPYLAGFSVSNSGAVLGQVFATAPVASSESSTVVARPGYATLWSGGGSVLVAPDGAHFAELSGSSAQIYDNTGNLVGAISASVEGWIDGTHLLANVPGKLTTSSVTGIYDVTGEQLKAFPTNALPAEAVPFVVQFPTATTAYFPYENAIYSLDTGTLIWQGPATQSVGTVAGESVVYQSGHQVVLYPQ